MKRSITAWLLAAALLCTALAGCAGDTPAASGDELSGGSAVSDVGPDTSVDPDNPDNPDNPADPDNPDVPADPDNPADPANPDSSAVSGGNAGSSGNANSAGSSAGSNGSGSAGSAGTTAPAAQGGTTTVTKDTVATTVAPGQTFSVPTTGLTKKTVYLLDKVVVTQAPKGIMPHDSARLVCSLQGLINRDFEKNQIAVYLNYETADSFWLSELTASGGLLNGYATVRVTSFEQFLEVFKNQIVACGLVQWDPDVPATANAAATICGLDGYLPVKYDDSDSGLLARLKDMGAKVKLSLLGKFTGKGIISGTKIASTGSTKCDTYLWAMDKYLSRTSKEMLAYMPDGAGCVATNVIYLKDTDAKDAYGNSILDHDYLIANQCFFFDLSPVGSEVPCDDTAQPLGTDLRTMKQIFQAQYDRNGGQFSKVIGFPPWWIKYTTHNSWGSLAATTVEWMFTDLATQYNLAKEADAAHPNCTANASLYEHVPLNSSFKNTNRQTTVTETFNKNTVYLLYYMGDYDSSAWLKYWVPTLWADSEKGQMPMMWSFNPNLSDRVPMVFNYIYSHMDSQDYFVSGDSGPGYIIPAALYSAVCPERSNPDGGSAWAAYAKPYMQRFDMDIVGFIINGSYKMNNTIMGLYNEIAPVGSFHNDPSKPLTVVKGVPYVYLKNGVGNPGDYTTSAQGMYDYLKTTMAGLNFGAFRTICWTPSQINDLSEAFLSYAKQKDPGTTYKFVDPYTYFAMIRQSGQGTIVN